MKKEKVKNIAIYQAPNGAIEFRGDYEEETIWGTQRQIAEVFGVDVRTINEHLINIYNTDELKESSTLRKFRIVQKEGSRKVERRQKFYNLDAIISVGYRIKSHIATKFRIWATARLKEYLIKGFTMDDERLKGTGGGNYWKELLDRIRDIRSGGDRETCRCRTSVHGAAHFFRRRSYQERYRHCQELFRTFDGKLLDNAGSVSHEQADCIRQLFSNS